MTNRTNRTVLLDVLLGVLRRTARVLGDIAYGIDAGSAIRHGLPVPPRRENAAATREEPCRAG